MREGVVKSVRVDKGYLFIEPNDGGKDVFAHCTKLFNLELDEQLQGRRVRFDSTSTIKGESAIRVEPAGDR